MYITNKKSICTRAVVAGYVLLRSAERRKRSFLSRPPALPSIKGLGRTKTHDKTFAVLGGFWHSAA